MQEPKFVTKDPGFNESSMGNLSKISDPIEAIRDLKILIPGEWYTFTRDYNGYTTKPMQYQGKGRTVNAGQYGEDAHEVDVYKYLRENVINPYMIRNILYMIDSKTMDFDKYLSFNSCSLKIICVNGLSLSGCIFPC